jgi:hypothetical protein
MISAIIFYVLIIIILFYYYHHSLQNHFWYHLKKNLGKSKFYSGKLHPNIYSKKDLKEHDKNKLVELYSNYMNGVVIDKEKIENFLSSMPHSEIFYMKVNSEYYGAVMNSIIEIKYKNKTYLSNFVDNAIVNNNYRTNGIFKELMNYIANYSNNMNAKFVIFKIDRKPIPSFYEYNLTSNYYCMNRNSYRFKKENSSKIVFESINNSKNIIILSCSSNKEFKEIDNWDSNYLGVSPFFKGAADNLGVSPFFKGAFKGAADNLGVSPFKKGAFKGAVDNLGVSPFFKGAFKGAATGMIFKRNSPESIELLYIYKPNQKNIINIIEHLFNNYLFDVLFVDDIGNNNHLINAFPNSFKVAYPVYHYILGLKEKISKENFFYYF